MTTLPAQVTVRPLRDALIMVRRDLRRMLRYPSLTFLIVAMPIVFLLLFVLVFGGTLGAGLQPGAGAAGRAAYLDYVVPGVLLMTLASASQGTAITVAMDMTQGIVARFRTMSIARGAVLTGHVVGSLLQSLVAVVVVVLVAVLLGYRPAGSPADLLGALAVLMLAAFAFTWLTVALGMAAGTVESASNTPMPLVLLPFLSSGFVPTDAMPGWLAAFAEHQPFTPMIETVRALLAGTPVAGADLAAAVGWSLAIAAAGYGWARSRYERLPAQP
ncbi:ABC transporter permease [Pseudonocardia sp. CA-107938]|uniref:ABC transporter permease n=1 Tax=Pseudonocardia sp. CA-107938 TaxID=3240021 RepID=UPI003D9328E4